MKQLFLGLSVLAVVGCSAAPPRLGVVLDEVGISKNRLGPSPPDIATRSFVSGSTRRVKEGDVVGDDRPERLVEAADGKGLELRSQAGELLAERKTPGYLTDFGIVPATAATKPLVVLYTYPNPGRGGTFTTMNGALEPVATWDESPPPGWFGVGPWKGQPALFYLQEDTLVVRTPMGTPLERLAAPDGHLFRAVYIQALTSGLMAVVVSGSGYMPYHMVCVYRVDRLVFQEIQSEHAFGVESTDGGRAFVVSTRTTRWKYAPR